MINPVQVLQLLPQLKANPVGFLSQHGMNVPANLANDPNAIIQSLMNSGKVNQQLYDQARMLAQQFGVR